MRVRLSCAGFAVLAIAFPVFGQRQWVVYQTRLQDNPWTQVSSGDFPGPPYNPNKSDISDTSYYWSQGTAGNIQMAFYDLTAEKCRPVPPNTDLFPPKPALYAVEQWAPNPAGSAWSGYLPIEVAYDASGEGNWSSDGFRSPFIPWFGQTNTNHQYITSNFDLGVTAGTWVVSGPGPHTPGSSACTGGNGSQMWIKRNSTLSFKFDYSGSQIVHPATAIRLTEVVWDNATCGAPVSAGSVDLRCAGNADPLYGTGEHFANNWLRSMPGVAIDDSWALAVNDYLVNGCNVFQPTGYFSDNYGLVMPQPPSPQVGLPGNGTYVAQGVTFQLHYDGLNTIKWKDGSTEFASSRVFTLNPNPGTPREFVPGHYKNISLLTMCSGGSGNQLNVEAVYGDGTTETQTFNLYDWFNQNGDANSVAVGVSGNRRDAGDVGFGRFKYGEGWTPNRTAKLETGGGSTSGAFPFVQTAWIDSAKVLNQINLSVTLTTGMSVNLLAMSLNSQPCNIPWADADGDNDVDMADFAVLQTCLTIQCVPGQDFGSGRICPSTGYWPIQPGCSCMDSNASGQIDTIDFNNFANCAMGPEIQYLHDYSNWPAGCPGKPN
jgi:hypothetical protein